MQPPSIGRCTPHWGGTALRGRVMNLIEKPRTRPPPPGQTAEDFRDIFPTILLLSVTPTRSPYKTRSPLFSLISRIEDRKRLKCSASQNRSLTDTISEGFPAVRFGSKQVRWMTLFEHNIFFLKSVELFLNSLSFICIQFVPLL